jgi:hypothetical protein
MNRHPYLRAYLAGICVPTIFLLVVATGFTFLRYVYNFPVPIERVIVFPMAVVPNLWGLWNILFLAWHERLHMAAAGLLNFSIPAFAAHVFPFAAPVALIVYYLAWKYLVGALNSELGVG